MTAEQKREGRPNIIFLLADDMGWMDSSVYGSEYYETPNLQRLASLGMTFTDAYSANPLCSPTRASLMTGLYPGRLKITTASGHLPVEPKEGPLLGASSQPWNKMVTPQSRRCLPLEEPTFSAAFHDAGYATGFIGKWHLGREERFWPRNRGFELDMGAFNAGPPSYFSPYRISTIPDGPEGEYITDRITDEALRYIEANRRKPFLLCLWHFAVHGPWQGKEPLIRKYREKTDPRGMQYCPTMGAMLESMDENIGRILDKLDELGLSDNTILLFTSDNGGNIHSEVDGRPPTNNYPLRSGKANIHEGGTRVPCIVRWPGVTRLGSRTGGMISSVDFYPTLLEMAGIPLPSGKRVDGISFVPLLKGEAEQTRDEIYCHFPHYISATKNVPATSVRRGDWKLIRFYGEGEDSTNAYALYNLRDDLGETVNLAGQRPELVAELDGLIDRHLQDIEGIVPIPNPDYDPIAEAPKKVRGED